MQVGEGDGTRSVGSGSPLGYASSLGLRINDVGNQVDGFFEGTKIVGGTQACNGTELCFGGDNLQTWHPATCTYTYAAIWSSSLSDGDWATVLQRMQDGQPVVGGGSSARPIGSPLIRRIG